MIRVATSEDECRDWWHRFSPHQRAWDEWDLMYAFHDQEHYTFHFLIHETDGNPDGLIPLVHDSSDASFELFGGCYPDARVLWIDIAHFPEFFEHLPDKTAFFDLRGAQVDEILSRHPQYAPNFAEHDQRFYLVPSEFDYDFTNHIATFSSEKRKGFLYDLRKIREKGPVLRWSDDDESDLFIALCNKNFGAESDYATEKGQAELKRVVRELKESGWLKTLTVSLDGVKIAVSLSAVYKGAMIALYAASNNEIKNSGKLLNVETIQEGCRLRVDEVNYMTGMTWKAAWKMKAEPCVTMRKPPKQSPPETPPAPAPAAGQT